MDHKRPIPVTALSILLILTGIIALIGSLMQIPRANALEISLASLVRLVAIVAGVFMLTGRSWSRWLCIAWFAYHIILSVGHTRFELIAHCVFGIAVCVILFSPGANAYFARDRIDQT